MSFCPFSNACVAPYIKAVLGSSQLEMAEIMAMPKWFFVLLAVFT